MTYNEAMMKANHYFKVAAKLRAAGLPAFEAATAGCYFLSQATKA